LTGDVEESDLPEDAGRELQEDAALEIYLFVR
jgi:hypothetical protein